MRINLSPQVRDDSLEVIKAGDVLTINGEVFDFTGLSEGATVEGVPCPWIIGPVERADTSLVLTLLLPCGTDAPEERRFPGPIINPADGAVIFPGDEA